MHPPLEWFELPDERPFAGWSVSVGCTYSYTEAGEPPEVRIYEVELNTGQEILKPSIASLATDIVAWEFVVADMILDRDTEHARYLAEAS